MDAKEKQISWMYEGAKASVNREEYLLGKRIDKNFQLYTDALRKDRDAKEDIFTKKEQMSISLPVVVVRQEDPLVAIKVQEEKKRQDLLNNPTFKMKAQRILMAEFQKMTKKKLKKKKKRKHHSDTSSDSESEADKRKKKKKSKKRKDSSSDVSDQSKHRVKGHRSSHSQPKPPKQGSSHEQEEARSSRSSSSSRSPTRHRAESVRQSSKNRSGSRGRSLSPQPSRRPKPRRSSSRSPERRPRREVEDQRRSPNRRRRERSRSPTTSRRKSPSPIRAIRTGRRSSPEPRKPSKAEEMERRRQEMMQNAKWKEDVKRENARFARAELEREQKYDAERESKSNATFIKAFKQMSESKTVADSVTSKSRHTRRRSDEHP